MHSMRDRRKPSKVGCSPRAETAVIDEYCHHAGRSDRGRQKKQTKHSPHKSREEEYQPRTAAGTYGAIHLASFELIFAPFGRTPMPYFALFRETRASLSHTFTVSSFSL